MFSIATVKVFNILSSVDREKVKDELFTNFCYCLVPFSFSFEARWDVRPYLFWQLKLKKFTLTAIKSWEVQLVLSSTKLNKILIELNLGCGLSLINAMFSLIKLNQKQTWTKLKCIVEITIVKHPTFLVSFCRKNSNQYRRYWFSQLLKKDQRSQFT